ncbi:hypothetical protein BpHYR1_034333 [Brachionus plicatilis]|uniref:Uncharacterized protein n=1 Tax=Brachionus plicatilis TaxID=10195 RepID=A0A3M7RLB3_BRAPC|nr:hypothetical protein BpHYR1_034333 [Brachionus plicatilis]
MIKKKVKIGKNDNFCPFYDWRKKAEIKIKKLLLKFLFGVKLQFAIDYSISDDRNQLEATQNIEKKVAAIIEFIVDIKNKNIALELIDNVFKCDNQGLIDSIKFIMTLVNYGGMGCFINLFQEKVFPGQFRMAEPSFQPTWLQYD